MAEASLFRQLISPIVNRQTQENRREDELSRRKRAITGQRGQQPAADGLGQVGYPAQPTGFLGGEMDLQEYYARMAAEPGMGSAGIQGLMNMGDNQALMNRQRQEQEYARQNMTMAQAETLKQRQAEMQVQQQHNQQLQQVAWKKQQMDYQKYLTGQEDKQFSQMVPLMEQKQETIRMVKKTNDALPRLSNGAADFEAAAKDSTIANQAIVTLAKSILPAENVMADDKGIIMDGAGYPGWLSGMVQQLRGGTLGETQLREIYTRLNANARHDMATLDEYRTFAGTRPGGGRGLPPRVNFPDANLGGTRSTDEVPESAWK